jgi:hypothetical protein
MLLLFLLGAYPVLASTFDSARGGPFDQVPAGDPAYDDCRYLAQCGVIDARPPGDFAGANPLARYDFSLSLVHPLSALEALATDSRRAGAGLEPVLDMSPAERARVGGILARLLDEFRDVLSVLGKDVSQAIRGARLMADGGYTPRAAAPAPENAAGVTFESSRARVGVIYRAAEGRAAALPPVPLGGLADAPITGLAAARLPVSRAAPASLAPRDDALTDFSLHRLRGSFEYGVTDNLSLAVAYEAAVRQGAGTTILDAASLKTLGLGYRFSPSTSVNLKYHLIDYADHTGAGARLEDRMAETDLVVRF